MHETEIERLKDLVVEQVAERISLQNKIHQLRKENAALKKAVPEKERKRIEQEARGGLTIDDIGLPPEVIEEIKAKAASMGINPDQIIVAAMPGFPIGPGPKDVN